MADVFESLIAAIYLDGGHEAVREFVERHVGPESSWRLMGSPGATTSRYCSNNRSANTA